MGTERAGTMATIQVQGVSTFSRKLKKDAVAPSPGQIAFWGKTIEQFCSLAQLRNNQGQVIK